MDDEERSREELLLELKELRQKNNYLERKLNEARLSDNWKIHGLFEKGPMAVAYHVMVNDESGKPVDYFFLDANDQYVKLTGVDPRGKNATEAFPGIENDPFDWIGVFGNVARNGETIRFEQFLEPNQRWYDCVAFQYKHDCFVAAFFEITARKKAENALVKSEARMGKMLANIGDVIAVNDYDGITRYKSPNIEKWFGWKPEELVGFSVMKVIHPDDRLKVQEFLGHLSKTPNSQGTIECKYQCRDGHYKWIEITSINLLHDPDIQGFLTNYHDITERRNAREHLVKLKEKAEESDRLKSAFLANMSHEIRTPLNGIIGFLDLLRSPSISKKQHEQFSALIKQSSDRLINTINDIIEISKIESGQCKKQITSVCVGDLLERLYSLFQPKAESKGLSLILKELEKHEVISVQSDEIKLESILSNLIDNAIKFTQYGFVEFGLKENENQIVFYVSDSGRGIPFSKIDAVFERFMQADQSYVREEEGSGLGLSIAKAYAEILNAQIWVESEVGKGSTFFLSLNETRRKENKPTIEICKQTSSDYKNGGLIVLAEDDEVSYIYLHEVLSSHNFEVLHALNGAEAVRLVQENPGVDLVLMDIKMPVMDGFEATKKIRKFNREIPVIAQTAFALTEKIDKMMQAGCNDYLTKPVNSEVLMQCIAKYM